MSPVFLAPMAMAAVLATSTPARPPIPEQMSCRLIAADGAILGLEIATRDRSSELQIRVAPAKGSTWPRGKSGYLKPIPGAGVTVQYVTREHPDILLSLGHTYPGSDLVDVNLTEKREGPGGMTLATGYCSDEPAPALAARNGSVSLTNLASLDEGCHVMARDGRHSRIIYSQGDHIAVLEPQDSAIWSSPSRIELPRVSPPTAPLPEGLVGGFATAGGKGLPNVRELFLGDARRGFGVLSLRFHRLEGTARRQQDEGFGICILHAAKRRGA